MMVNGLPYYRAYPRDFFEGTVGMPFEVKSIYRLLLDLIYLRGGTLEDDPSFICGNIGCSVRRWNSTREDIWSRGKIAFHCPWPRSPANPDLQIISNFRADKERIILQTYFDKQRENGAHNKGKQAINGSHGSTDGSAVGFPRARVYSKPLSKKERAGARKNGFSHSQKQTTPPPADPAAYPWNRGLSFGENNIRSALWQWARTRNRPGDAPSPIPSHHLRDMLRDGQLTEQEHAWLSAQHPEKAT